MEGRGYNFEVFSSRCFLKEIENLFSALLSNFLILMGPCARSDWSKTHVLSEYKT